MIRAAVPFTDDRHLPAARTLCDVGFFCSHRKWKGARVFYHLDLDGLPIAEIANKVMKAQRGNGGAQTCMASTSC